MKHKILFLDIDGVLAGYDWFVKRKDGGDFIDPDNVNFLNLIDCEIVISSSWGEDGGRTERCLRDKGLKLPIIGYTEHHEIGSNWIVRGNSIQKWLQDNMEDSDYQYAIVDDNADMLLSQKDHLVQTNEAYGLTIDDVEKICKILSSDIP